MDEIAPQLAERAAEHDREGSFVEPAFRLLRDRGFFAAGVPADLGGGGAAHAELCDALRRLAHACPATALAASMHTHLVAAAVWNHRQGKGGTPLLKKVAEKGLVLVSTGAGDWLRSNGEMERVEGGYRVTATKAFGSGSPLGDSMITSSVYRDPEEGEQILHFPVPLSSEGVSLAGDWDALGMRGTGSQTIRLQRVFVPDEAIALRRPRGGWHDVWNVVLTVAIPVFMAPYVGIAEAAREAALEHAKRASDQPHVPFLVGEMDNALATARMTFRHAVANAAEYDFTPSLPRANEALVSKTLMAESTRRTVDKAMELVGGAAYLRRTGIERLHRDVRAADFHPLPEKRQQYLSGRLALGLDPM